MAILKIVTEGDPVLRKTSRPVDEISPRIIRLLDDMKATLHKAEGVGLAAVQVGVLRRVVLVEVEPGELYEMINPVIIEKSGQQNELEGCLSVPGKWGITDRPMYVKVKATDRYGKEYTVEGEGLKARALCHELDHLDGKLYTDCAVRMLTQKEIEELE
ncbi:MAG: peptide deformylase [Ruminococcaceae bacterium]|nr:peptide deformylase [Oscillospiraceae bacterium]